MCWRCEWVAVGVAWGPPSEATRGRGGGSADGGGAEGTMPAKRGVAADASGGGAVSGCERIAGGDGAVPVGQPGGVPARLRPAPKLGLGSDEAAGAVE